MSDNFNPPFAHLNTSKRVPNVQETEQGFGCGPADLKLFNGMFNRIEAAIADICGKLGVQQDGLPLSIRLANSDALTNPLPGTTPQSVPPLIDVRCNNMVEIGGNFPNGSWDGSALTITEETQGSFGIYNRLNIQGEVGEGAKTYLNGLEVDSYQLNTDAGNSNVVGFTHFLTLKDGDVLEFYHRHQSIGDRSNALSYATVYRFLAL